LQHLGLTVESQKPIAVYYEEILVGEFIADILVAEKIIVELKSVRTITPSHEVQLVNYLTATGKTVGLLINFGEATVEIRRKARQRRKADS
jgi:GxxExxY protein